MKQSSLSYICVILDNLINISEFLISPANNEDNSIHFVKLSWRIKQEKLWI